MINTSTIDKLIEMHMTPMADAFRAQLNAPKIKEVSFDDRFDMLVDIEYTTRKNNARERLIKKASMEQPDASIVDINYQSGRKLNKSLISKLASCEYIRQYRNIFITGATGARVILLTGRKPFKNKDFGPVFSFLCWMPGAGKMWQ